MSLFFMQENQQKTTADWLKRLAKARMDKNVAAVLRRCLRVMSMSGAAIALIALIIGSFGAWGPLLGLDGQGLLIAGASGAAADSGPARLPDELTPREVEVLGHIAAGLSNTEIATTLFVSEATVKSHINHIFTKTGLRDRAQLVGYAFRHGLATPS